MQQNQNTRGPFRLPLYLLCSLVIGLCKPASAELEQSGYYKNILFQSGDALYTGNRLRLKYNINFDQHISAEIQYTNQLTYGIFPVFQTPLNSTNFIKTDRVLRRDTGLDWTHSLYRGFVSFAYDDIDVVIGRQRIAWGTGRFWNPTDLLNPFDPTNIEGSERTGVDAINLRITTDRLSYLSLVGAMGSDLTQTSLAARYHTTIGPHDISLMTGRFRESLVIGGDYAGAFKGAGVRVESSYTLSPIKNFWKLVFSVDYQFPGVYVLGEYFYNGQGENDKKKYDYAGLVSGRLTTIGQNYLGLTVNKTLSMLTSISAQLLLNLNDGSFLMGPTFSYSLSSNTDLIVGVNWFMGLPDTEYGRSPILFFNQVQWSF